MAAACVALFAAADPAFATQTASVAPQRAVAAAQDQELAGFAAKLHRSLKTRAAADLREAYAKRGHRPIWARETDDGRIAFPNAEPLLEALEAAAAHALPVTRYRPEALRARLVAFAELTQDPSDPAWLRQAAELERDLSRSFVDYARDVSSGAIEPRKADKDIKVKPRRPDPTALLTDVGAAIDKRYHIARLAPQSDDYRLLLVEYARALEAARQASEAPPLRTRKTLKPGETRPQVVSLRERLEALGAVPASFNAIAREEGRSDTFDDGLADAVRAFQRRNGLAVDAVVGPQTRRALNTSPVALAEQIAVNLERIRWRNYDLGRRHLRVNLANFEVELIEDGETIFRSDVVVGKAKDHETPEFSDEMTHIVFNPVWHVPYSIATEEILPKVQDYPGYIEAKNMWVSGPGGGFEDPWYIDWSALSPEFFPYRIKQRSGSGNALGEVKFIFPNQYSIYLHDTPAKKLFRRSYRAFSHGCVRVAEPQALAEALLAVEEADPARFYRRATRGDRERHRELREPVPIHLTYRTAWVDRDGVLQLRPDFYRRDGRVAHALRRAGVALPDA